MTLTHAGDGDLFVSAELSGQGWLRVALISREFPQYAKS